MLIFDNRSVIIFVKSKSKVKREDSKTFASSSPSLLLQDFTDIIKYCTSSPVLVLPRRLSAGEGDQYFRSKTVSWRRTLDENGRERR